MACALNKEQVLDLYQDIYKDISDRIGKPDQALFDLDEYMKDLYKDIYDENDPSKALLYIQAVPEILLSVASLNDVRAYLYQNKISLDPVVAKSVEFENLEKVDQFLNGGPKLSVEQIKEALKTGIVQSKAVKLKDPEKPFDNYVVSTAQGGARVTSVNTTTIQFADPRDPDTVSDEERDTINAEKDFFGTIIKTVVDLANDRAKPTDPIMLQGVSIKLRPLPLNRIREEYLTKVDLDFVTSQGPAEVVFAFISDENGNLLFFDENGLLTDEENGRPVYAGTRVVTEKDGKLWVSNRSNRYYSIVSPVEQAQAMKNRLAEQGIEMTPTRFNNTVATIKEQQEKEINDLHRLRSHILLNPDEVITLPITGGSLGFVNKEFVPLSETEFTAEDLEDYDVIDSGPKKGYSYFTVQKEVAGTTVNSQVFLQRGDITEELATKIADVLTTTAKLNGEQLDPETRVKYAQVFLNNSVDRNRISIALEKREGVEQLTVRLKKSENGVIGKPIDLSDPETAKEIIVKHLMTAVVRGTKTFPANVSYNKEYIRSNEFVDYVISGNKIVEKRVNYFNTIKPFIKVEYSKDSYGFFKGMNSYMFFSIPQNIVPADGITYEIGHVTKEKLVKERAPKKVVVESGAVKFETSKTPSYADASKKAMNEADSTLIFAVDFNNATEKLNKSAKNYTAVELDRRSKTSRSLMPSKAAVDNIVNKLNDIPHGTLNINGNDATILFKKGYTQDSVDKYMYNFLKAIVESENLEGPINQIVTTGQSGISLAIIKAAAELNIGVRVIAPKGYKYRVYAKNQDGFRDVTGKAAFMKRFSAPTEKAETVKEEEGESEINVDPIAKLLSNVKTGTGLQRSKLWDTLEVSEADKQKADEWWSKSDLSKFIPLERITAIVNSNAFAIWTRNGITLYEADGGTSVDLYHEAWHGFSQLYLTQEEKQELYDTMKKMPKWKDADYEDIEEALAEDFRDYALGKSKATGVIAKIFSKIKEFLNRMFRGLKSSDSLNPRDIPIVNEYFKNLYFNKNLNLQPSVDNVYPEFNKLNSKLRTINLVKDHAKSFSEFNIMESEKVKRMLDGMIAQEFRKYNNTFYGTADNADIAFDPTNRELLYNVLKTRVRELLESETEKLSDITIANLEKETPDYAAEYAQQEKVDFLLKTYENFGEVKLSLDGKQRTGVIAYHQQNSMFSILKRSYLELEDDPTDLEQSSPFKDQLGNVVSAKSIASEDTMILLSSIYKIAKDKDGNTIINSDGGIEYEKDEFGIPVLENSDIMWNKLAKIVAGSVDPIEMYKRLNANSDNYPEFVQVLEMLPQGNVDTNFDNTNGFKLETNLFQDLAKPRIRYIQLTVTKNILQKAELGETPEDRKEEIATYKSAVIKADFNTSSTINEWKINFVTATPDSNPYIELTDYGVELNTSKLVKEFSSNGVFNYKRSYEFLKALGISLDMTSPKIKSIVEDPQFVNTYNVRKIFEVVKLVNDASKSTNLKAVAAAQKFKKDPIAALRKNLSKEITTEETEVKGRINALARLQQEFSDSQSNFSVLTPENNRVWEHFLNSTATRIVTDLSSVNNFFELVSDYPDPNGRYKHMRWLAFENNTQSKYSVLLNSVFHLDDPLADNYGDRRINNELKVEIISGTQLVTENTSNKDGVSTANSDAISKNLQEINSMLLNGIQEFMRHASKQTSMGLSADDVITYPSKRNKKLYVDITQFRSYGYGEKHAFNIISKYMAGELERIYRFKKNLTQNLPETEKFDNWAGYNREVEKKDGTTVMAGEVFTAFDDVLTEDVKEELYALVDDALASGTDVNLLDTFDANEKLRDRVKKDVANYFNKQTELNLNKLEQARYIDDTLFAEIGDETLTRKQVDRVLMKAYTYNSWIHNFETVILMYGDLVQYNHDKEEFHKRNAGLSGTGRIIRDDLNAIQFVAKSKMFKSYHRKYDGTFKTAILREKKVNSIYYDEYREELIQSYKERFKDKPDGDKLAVELVDKALKDYKGMKEADGQGHVTLESYRLMKWLEGSWSDDQERLYKKASKGEKLTVSEIVEFFPPYKLQYYGPIQTKGLPLVSLHKFSLAPIIPSVVGNANISKINKMMMDQGVDYVLFETGSKVGHIGNGDQIYKEDESVDSSVSFTPNVIFAHYLKNQTEINKSYKNKSIFSTQLRKLVLEGLYEKGVIQTINESEIKNAIVKKYIDDVSDYTELLKQELLEEIGYEQVGDEFKPVSKDSSERVAQMIRDSLTKEDVQGDHLIEFIDVNADGTLKYDLSLHPEAVKIEKLLLSIINKRIIKQKVKGEPLVQVSGAMYENLFEVPDLRKGTEADRKKYMGSNFLPTYHKGKDGKTTAMKVAVALQGDFNNLLKLEYNNQTIGDINTLNEAIKDDTWMEINRDKVTMVGVRIPVQGLNSMEFMEVYHFLDPSAGNIIIPPAEIVAKSGADFDIDKLTIFMPTISSEGQLPTLTDKDSFQKEIDENKKEGNSNVELYAKQKAAYENSMILDIRNILELPENYVSLVTPNGTYLVKPIADMLSEYVMDYNPFENMSSDKSNLDKDGKQVISPTRVLESQYNLFKHESNVVGKRTLGIGAVQNTLNVLYNSLKIGDTGATMPASFIHSNEKTPRESHLYIKHNTVIKDGKKVISIGSRYDAENVNKVADVISQLMNGWVDVEKDAWIFFLQGNFEVAPTLLYLVKAGVPIEDAVYFVSQPLVREYVKEQRLARSMFADVLRRKQKPALVNFGAATKVIYKYFPIDEAKKLSKNINRYNQATKMADEYFEGEKKEFSKEEMLKLIKDFKKNPKAASSELSKLMFLHFIETEQAVTGLSKLRSVINPDTSTKSDIFQVEQAESSAENIMDESKIDSDIPAVIFSDSILKSFFNTKLSLAVARPMFPLRYHPAVTKFLMQDPMEIKDLADSLFNGNKEQLINTFRNDMIASVFQNALRKYTVSDAYKSYTVEKSVPINLVDKLEYGVYVKKDESGNAVMYVDMNQLEREFETGEYTPSSKSPNSYIKRGLHPLVSSTFKNNKNSNKEEYIRFVLEREFLRSMNPFIDIQDTASYEQEYLISKSLYPSLSQEKLVRATYERWLANKALDNTFNPYHMFKDKTYSMGVRLSNILSKYYTLPRDYTVLSRMKVEANEDQNMFNILIAEKDYDNAKSNLYYEELNKLADPTVVKVSDPQENLELSDFFKRLSLFAFIQSGLNKTKYNFTNVVNYQDFLNIMDGAANDFIKELDKPTSEITLSNLFQQFITITRSKDKNRFKDLVTSSENKEAATAGLNVVETSKDHVFIYDDTTASKKNYKDTIEDNPSKVFIYNISQKNYSKPPAIIPGQGLIKLHAKDMSIGLITGLNSVEDGFDKVPQESYPVIKANFEAMIAQIKNLIDNGTDVAFSSNGYGNQSTMPQELFVYLSKRLYEEFKYINPGSLKFQEISETIGRQQGISDQDIIQEFENEEEPFKCKL